MFQIYYDNTKGRWVDTEEDEVVSFEENYLFKISFILCTSIIISFKNLWYERISLTKPHIEATSK